MSQSQTSSSVLAALTGLELAALNALISPSRSKMRYLTGSRLRQLGLAGARRDVLRAIQAGAGPRARPCFVAKRREAPRQIGLVLQLSKFRERVDLERPSVGVVHQHDRDTIVAAACTARQPLRPLLLLRRTGT